MLRNIDEGVMIALDSLRVNKLRSFLTLLGMIVAVATFMIVLSVLQGFNSYVDEKIADVRGMGLMQGVEFKGDDAHAGDVEFDLRVAHGVSQGSKVMDWMTTGVCGTSVGKGPPEPVGVWRIFWTTSMPDVTLPKTV